jgi:hypothetical protein
MFGLFVANKYFGFIPTLLLFHCRVIQNLLELWLWWWQKGLKNTKFTLGHLLLVLLYWLYNYTWRHPGLSHARPHFICHVKGHVRFHIGCHINHCIRCHVRCQMSYVMLVVMLAVMLAVIVILKSSAMLVLMSIFISNYIPNGMPLHILKFSFRHKPLS